LMRISGAARSVGLQLAPCLDGLPRPPNDLEPLARLPRLAAAEGPGDLPGSKAPGLFPGPETQHPRSGQVSRCSSGAPRLPAPPRLAPPKVPVFSPHLPHERRDCVRPSTSCNSVGTMCGLGRCAAQVPGAPAHRAARPPPTSKKSGLDHHALPDLLLLASAKASSVNAAHANPA